MYFDVSTFVAGIQTDVLPVNENVHSMTREEILDLLERINYETKLADEKGTASEKNIYLVIYEHNNGCDRDIFAYDTEEAQQEKFKEVLDKEIEHVVGSDDFTPYDEALEQGYFHCYDVTISAENTSLNPEN